MPVCRLPLRLLLCLDAPVLRLQGGDAWQCSTAAAAPDVAAVLLVLMLQLLCPRPLPLAPWRLRLKLALRLLHGWQWKMPNVHPAVI